MTFPAYPAYKDSSVDWLADIPSHWNIKKFRYVFEESPEKITDEVVGDMLSVSGYRGIEVKQYDDEGRRRTDEELFGYRVVRQGQLVVNTMWLNYAGLGVSEYVGHVSPAYRSYWIDPAMDKRFIHHLMRSGIYVKGYTRLLTGIRPNSLQMGRDDLMVFPVLLPTKSEQTQIARFLDHETARIDALIEEQQRLIELLKEKRQAVISHAVTKGLDPTAPMKDSGVEWLGEVPAHWEVVRLKNVSHIVDCKNRTPDYIDDGDYLVVRTTNIKKQQLSLEGALYTDRKNFEVWTERGVPPPGSIFFTREAPSGEVCIVPENIPLCMGQRMMNIIPNDANLTTFIFDFLTSDCLERYIESQAAGSTVVHLRVEQVHNIPLVLPPEGERYDIDRLVSKLKCEYNSLIQYSEAGIELLCERRSALISAAVTGKIDVRGWQPPAADSWSELSLKAEQG